MMAKIDEKLMRIQTKIKAPKNLYNSFGKYKYRNVESICEAVKPFLVEEKCSLTLEDDIVEVGGRVYVKATATLYDSESQDGEAVCVTAFAREAENKKGMDDSQITGTASSYARKYALNGMFLLDDTKDADTDEYHKQNDVPDKNEDIQKQIEGGKISSIKLESLVDKCKEDGIDVTKLLGLYKLKDLAEMNEKQFSNAINHWEDIKKV